MKKIINKLLVIGMIIGDIFLLSQAYQNENLSRVPTYLVLFPILIIPTLLKKFSKLKISDSMELVYLLFIFLAQFLGSCVNLYNKITWFDTFTHFISGILSCFIALILSVHFGQNPKQKIFYNITYILGIVFLIAGIWEFFEFGMDKITGSNLQHWIETGVEDTMFDTIAAFSGSIFFIIVYLYEMFTEKKGFITDFINSIK